MHFRFLPFLLSATLLGFSAVAGHAQRPEARAPLALSHLAPALPPGQLLGRTSATKTLALSLVLPLRNRAALNTLLRRISDPKDALYGHYLTPDQFAQQFGPDPTDVEAVEAFAQAHGLTVKDASPDGTLVHATGPVSTVESAFGVHLNDYAGTDGRAFFAPDHEPTVSADIAGRVLSVLGLSNAQKAHAFSQPTLAEPLLQHFNGHQGLAPRDIKSVYGLSGTTYTGTGQVAALFELGTYTPSDITTYFSYYNIPPTLQVNPVSVEGYSTSSPPDGGTAGEVTLDIDMLAALAPGLSQIRVYEEDPNSQNSFSKLLVDSFTAMSNETDANRPSVISVSYGFSENFASASDSQALDQATAKLASQGQTVCVASGDSGAYTDQGKGVPPNVAFPANDPYVLAVGGTDLADGLDGNGNCTYLSETSWADPNDQGRGPIGTGGGGGYSTYWPIPAYQSGAFTATSNPQGSLTQRNMPDVSLFGDYDTGGYDIYLGGWAGYNGTSAASPLWAAFLADVNQARAAKGRAALGSPNPAIYQVAESSSYAALFHDIADGSNNLYYNTVAGYDNSTGWGSFQGDNLLAALTALTDVPTNLTATPNFTEIDLKWQALVPAGATFNVYRGTSPGGEDATPLATGVTTTSYADTQITTGVTYYYLVREVETGGGTTTVSDPSNEAHAVIAIFYVPSTTYPTIQSAITAASSGSIVRVADGTYAGPGNVDLDMGGKNLLVASVNGADKTFIECGGTASAAHRAFHFHSGETTAAVQGFTMQHAAGPDEGAVRVEAGSQATIFRCVFANNTSAGSGGGAYVDGTASFTQCVFTGNVAQGGYAGGAAIYSNGTWAATNCTFVSNQSGNYGGALDVNDGVGAAANCLFTGNTAATGSIVNNFGALSLVNCSATQNAASGGLAIYSGGTLALTNDILWNDAGGELDTKSADGTVASHCDVMGGYPGAGDIAADPLFLNPTVDLHVQAGSPCLGKGTAVGAATTDLDGRTRPTPPSIGAYEGSSLPSTATAVANVSGLAGQTVTLSATVTSGGAGVAGGTVSFTVDGVAAGSAGTNASGTAALPYAIPAGDAPNGHPITATFGGGGSLQGSSGAGTLTVTRTATAVTVSSAGGSVGQTITVTATLTRTDTNAGVPGETVTFTQDAASVGTGVTNASGVATRTYVIPKGTTGGPHPLNAVFAGDTTFAPSTGAGAGVGTLTVPFLGATLGFRSVTGAPGARVTLSAQLSRTDTGAGIGGAAISFTLDGTAVGAVTTDPTGSASFVYALPAGIQPGSHAVVVTFTGDSFYNAAQGNGTVTVSKVVTALAGKAVTGSVGQAVTLSARMNRPDTGAVLPGKSVAFTVDGTAAGSATTAASGFASLTYVIPGATPVGGHVFGFSFAGDSLDNPAGGTAALTVTKASTRIAVAHVLGARGTSAMLTAKLTRATDGGVLTGKTVTFAVDGTPAGTATTDSTGTATLPYPIAASASVGSHTVTVTFTGDASQNAGTGAGTLVVN